MNREEEQERKSPLSGLHINFMEYVQKRQNRETVHMDGNAVLDYAFGMDYELRKKLDSIPHLYRIAKHITATIVSRNLQLYNRAALAVGPNQLPEVYQMASDCARTLGIGIPNLFILTNPEINAFTYACEDIEPIIVIHSGLYERADPQILKAIIGHECGHIQNAHTMYQIVGRTLAQGGLGMLAAIPGVRSLTGLLTAGTQIALNSWSRAAEVTADRAAAICSSPEDAVRAMMFLMYGGTPNVDVNSINLDAIMEQLKLQVSNISKYGELLGNDHPATARRIAALLAFQECAVLYSWRPELRQPGVLYQSKAQTEERCRAVINVTKKG